MVAQQFSRQTLAVVLAGGQGSRLGALTRGRCKPALWFGGSHRSIDFTLSNCLNSGVTQIGVATQYRAQPLIQHIRESWSFLNRERGEFIELWPAEQREEARWYAGTADAVYQNLIALNRYRPRYVLVLAADHIYRMDYSSLLAFHSDNDADLTIACQTVPAEQARHFGVMSVEGHEIESFREKPFDVAGSGHVLASMGVYVFGTDLLRELLCNDALQKRSTHDFGRDLIPACVRSPDVRVCAHRFRDPCTGGPGYWRDIGTVDAYWQANMDLLSGVPGVNPYDSAWPIWSAPDRSPPTRVQPKLHSLATLLSQAVVAGGCRLDGASVQRSILCSGVHVGPHSIIEESILLPGARVGAGCTVRRAIIDEGVELPCGTNLDECAAPAGHCREVSPAGVTVLSRSVEHRRPGVESIDSGRRFGSTAADSRSDRAAYHRREPQLAGGSLQ